MPKNRPDKVEFEKRLMAIQSWMIEGAPSTLIVQNIMLKEWAKSERHAFILLQKGRERWIKFEDASREDKRKMRIQELKNQIRGMNNIYKGTPAGMRAILMIQKEISKLEGLTGPIKIEHTGHNGEPIKYENVSNVDITKLSTDVLKQIVNARIKPNI